MDNELTVESIDSQIKELRSNPAYYNEYRRGTAEQKELHGKVHELYAKKRELTNSGEADTIGNKGAMTVEDIDSQIDELRSNPAYNDRFRHGTKEQKALHAKAKELYAMKRELAGTDTNGNVRHRSLDPNNIGDLKQQAEAELELLREMGIDTSGEDISEVGQAEVDGYRRIRLIEQGDFDGLSPVMVKSARRAGYGLLEIAALRGFLRTKFEGNNGLKKKILRLISEDIYSAKGA